MNRLLPRNERDFARAQLSADRIRAAGGSATDEVLGCVAEMQRPQFIHNRVKLAADLSLARGATHEANRRRFGALWVAGRRDLNEVIRLVTNLSQTATRELQPWGDRAVADRLRHDLLILRWLRRYHPEQIPEIVEALHGLE